MLVGVLRSGKVLAGRQRWLDFGDVVWGLVVQAQRPGAVDGLGGSMQKSKPA